MSPETEKICIHNIPWASAEKNSGGAMSEKKFAGGAKSVKIH